MDPRPRRPDDPQLASTADQRDRGVGQAALALRLAQVQLIAVTTATKTAARTMTIAHLTMRSAVRRVRSTARRLVIPGSLNYTSFGGSPFPSAMSSKFLTPPSTVAGAGGLPRPAGGDAAIVSQGGSPSMQHPILKVLDGDGGHGVRRGSEVLAEVFAVIDEGLPFVTPSDPEFAHLTMMRRLLEPVALQERRSAPSLSGAAPRATPRSRPSTD